MQKANLMVCMATSISDLIFWICAAAILVAQVMILRSTRRGMLIGPASARTPLEWAFAVGPAVAVLLLLIVTWRTMHPTSMLLHTVPVASGAAS
jgi:heme/copper-type cytochrome/quinol oxidase subunit 2